ncbi:hypothetical protein [Methylocaldum sp.]|uniref:type II toxin-antitoxin system RelE family toxin n=1 Tax=Methylocaldum sp. TaxID=1969727 RepID=UPI002D6D8251|nr:hypothetical protein [Methylocaldum sp.]HYE35665.1 hypothetical protein [Methylocaldum sp.]
MTIAGAGGVAVKTVKTTVRFDQEFKKLTPELKSLCKKQLAKLLHNPMPSGIRFEKLKGYNRPSLYSIHVTGNYKISLEINGDTATLRRVACHDEIDRAP